MRSMRLMSVCISAVMLPTSIVMTLKTARAGAHMAWMGRKAVKKILAIANMPGPMTMPLRWQRLVLVQLCKRLVAKCAVGKRLF